MDRKADVRIKNNDSFTALTYCIKCTKPDILDFILKYGDNIDVNMKSVNGGTPLHYCAYTDNVDCTKVLLKYGAKICILSEHGYFPIHVAAFRCANQVFNLLLQEGKKQGCNKLSMLSFNDADNNKPLHASVQVCNIEAVKLCLDNGSKINEICVIDNSTPVHIACAQGSLDILKVMFEKQTELVRKVLHMKDTNHMTPLHKACMFDHVDIVDYLIQNGANINAEDKDKRSPLLLAASRNCVQVVCYLLEKDANFMLRDLKLRNFLHLFVSHTKTVLTSVTNCESKKSAIGNGKMNEDLANVSIHALQKVAKILVKVCSSAFKVFN